MILLPRRPTRTATVLPYTTSARSAAAGVDEVAIETFAHYFRLLEHSETGMIPESAIEQVDMPALRDVRSEEHTYELQSLMRKSYAVFCLKKKTKCPKKIRHNSQITDTRQHDNEKLGHIRNSA